MKLRVNKEDCIGCGQCQGFCPEVFEIEDDQLAGVVVDEISEQFEEDAIEAKDACPTGAIVEVEE